MLYIMIFIILIFLSEIGAYIWHRWGAHDDIVPKIIGVQNSHKIHHTDETDKAHGDFFYIIVILITLLTLLIYLTIINKISYYFAIIIFAPIALISFWNWYIHAAYHTDDHWLLKYQWFRDDKRIHFQHHINPSVNYGIATHFSDIIMDTFDYGLINLK